MYTRFKSVWDANTVHLFIIITNTSLANTSSEKKIGYEKRWNLALPLIPSSVFTTKTSKVRINISFKFDAVNLKGAVIWL